eukprot:18174_6
MGSGVSFSGTRTVGPDIVRYGRSDGELFDVVLATFSVAWLHLPVESLAALTRCCSTANSIWRSRSRFHFLERWTLPVS